MCVCVCVWFLFSNTNQINLCWKLLCINESKKHMFDDSDKFLSFYKQYHRSNIYLHIDNPNLTVCCVLYFASSVIWDTIWAIADSGNICNYRNLSHSTNILFWVRQPITLSIQLMMSLSVRTVSPNLLRVYNNNTIFAVLVQDVPLLLARSGKDYRTPCISLS